MAKINIPIKPELNEKREVWKRIESLVADREEDYQQDTFCKKFPNEPAAVYKLRKSIFADGFINPTIEMISAPGHTIYGNEIKVELGRAKNSRLINFIDNCTMGTKSELSLDNFLRENVCPMQRSYGTSFILLDMPDTGDNRTEQQQIDGRVWPYVTRIENLNVRNYEILNGELVWFMYEVKKADPWIDPTLPQPGEKKQYRVWTKTEYQVWTLKGDGEFDIARYPNRFKFVPVIVQGSFLPTSASIIGEAPFFASSRQLIMANNMLHIVNMELMKHANSMLLINKDSLSAHNSTQDKSGQFRLKTIPEDNAFVWSGINQYQMPQYLIRDLGVIAPSIEQYRLYMNSAFDNEKSAKSVAKEGYGGDDVAKSGFAMIVEREPILANIVATAMDMQSIHKRVLVMADAMINDGRRDTGIEVEYDMDYDIEAFSKLLENTKALMEARIPSTIVKQEQHKRVAARVVTEPDKRKEAFDEIEAHDYGENTETDEQINAEINNLFSQGGE